MEDIDLIKKRIWNRMESKLPERGFSSYQGVLNSFKVSKPLSAPRLRHVQAKENMLNLLPDRPERVHLLAYSKRFLAMSTLSMFCAALFLPAFSGPKLVAASAVSTLEVAQGEVRVNGELVTGTVFLQEGDNIYTESASMAHIVLLDDSRLTLAPNTHITFTDVQLNPMSSSVTGVMITQHEGRLWSQFVNPVSPDAYLSVQFPHGELSMYQRAMVDIELVDDETQINVARNVVEVNVQADDNYAGTLGQGTSMLVSSGLEFEELNKSFESDLWWTFNLAYGKEHLRHLDERYKREAIDRINILPGNPLYKFKTFREDVQEVLTFTNVAKQELQLQHAENRLNEARVLIDNGNLELAEDVLNEYQKKIDEVESDTAPLVAQLEEVQKAVSVDEDEGEGVELLEDHLAEATLSLAKTVSEKSELRMLSASQKLARLPDLLEDGNYEQAAEFLSDYQDESMSLLLELEGVSLEEKEEVVSSVLDRKLSDFDMLRVVSSMPEFNDSLDAESQILEEMGVMILSLREKSLTHVSEFFAETNYDIDAQQALYDRLKDSSDLTTELSDQFDDVEAEIAETESDDLLVTVELVEEPVQDTRLLDFSHSDESEDETEGSD
ncbi:hypothetical protein HOD30_03075 [Candidatus Peregrinibacteria bacterium]|nr:hypothetical protein [Candidatus Peregrinibacteria bacterium]MBT4632075.1 hypothetical protein [Candidatus Peregrinibacteria bacterium]